MEYELQNLDADFIFLGSGDKSYENLFIWLSNNTKNIRAYVGYNGALANKLYAGSDFFLMPSKFEPCGLSQLIAMRYGSLPIVRATGGLDNTVVGYPLDDSTGFKFWEYNGYSMKDAILCAMNVYKDTNCDAFTLKSNKDYDPKDYALETRMHKAIAVIQFKLEGQLVDKHPYYEMSGLKLLDKINFEKRLNSDFLHRIRKGTRNR